MVKPAKEGLRNRRRRQRRRVVGLPRCAASRGFLALIGDLLLICKRGLLVRLIVASGERIPDIAQLAEEVYRRDSIHLGDLFLRGGIIHRMGGDNLVATDFLNG